MEFRFLSPLPHVFHTKRGRLLIKETKRGRLLIKKKMEAVDKFHSNSTFS